jgi:predicted phosphodiesterase
VRIGLIADLHYADKPDAKDRCYRSSLEKIRRAVEAFNRAGVDFAIELGDFVDEGPTLNEEIAYVRRIEAEFAGFRGERHHVLGNHCVWTLTKNEFLRACSRPAPDPYYSFDHKGFHFVVLDACYRPDEHPYGRRNSKWTEACLPAAECDWLRRDLAQAAAKTVVFIHQRLDVAGEYAITNAPAVRNILDQSGKVLAVVQGHYHRGGFRTVGAIHYVTLSAAVTGTGPENNAYAMLEIRRDGSMDLRGSGRQESYTLVPAG